MPLLLSERQMINACYCPWLLLLKIFEERPYPSDLCNIKVFTTPGSLTCRQMCQCKRLWLCCFCHLLCDGVRPDELKCCKGEENSLHSLYLLKIIFHSYCDKDKLILDSKKTERIQLLHTKVAMSESVV